MCVLFRLTAFVIKSFAQASKLNMTTIDVNVVDRAANFILNSQAPNGDFMDLGNIIHKAMAGGSSSSVNSLTAYGLIALQEVKNAELLQVYT